MGVLFVDASALTKRYLMVIGSFWTFELFDPQKRNTVYVSGLTRVEVSSAFKKKLNTGSIDANQYHIAILQFRHALNNEYLIIEVTPDALEEAMVKVDQYGLRAYDAVQLSTAILLNREFLAVKKPPITFISADDKLNAVATAEGLSVDNPNHHPATSTDERSREEGNL